MPAAPTGKGRGLANADFDPQRLSLVSGTSHAKELEEGYTGIKTPQPIGAPPPGGPDGALREGGVPNLTSKENIGLLFQYAVVGLVYGVLPETIYPFMQEYINCSGSQVIAADQLISRRPYMLIGWTICIIMLLIMAVMPIGKPYYTVSSDRDIDVADYTPEIEARIDYDAPSEGAKYVILMFFAAFGYVMSDVCADSITCELAQREPLDKRGKTQSCIYIVRTIVVIIGEIIVGFCFNGEEYSGDFDFSLSFLQLMIVMLVLTVPVLPATWFFIKEEKSEAVTGMMITSKWGLHWNWRVMTVFTGAIVMIVDCACSLITVWDVFRSQWFWLGPPIAVELPYGIGWIISTFVVVELAGMGNKGAMYGLITTVGNIFSPFASTLTLLIDGPFNITNTRVQTDEHSIRADITYTIIIMYAMTIFSWFFLFLLPPQKEATQELVRKGGHNKILGGFTVAYLLFALIWSITTNILAIFDSTSCFIIGGGTGC